MGRLAFEQPAVENQQVSAAAFPAQVMLAAGYAVHPGFTSDSGYGLAAIGAVAGHGITMKNRVLRLKSLGPRSGRPAKKPPAPGDFAYSE
jgi:hypothetical protein